MIFERFEVPGLSQYSYAIGDGNRIAFIDPKRDIDTYLEYARSRNLHISYVLETHIHADFVSGARALAAKTGAELCLSAYTEGEKYSYRFDYRSLREGDELSLGALRLKVLQTPGHTPEHISVLVSEPSRSEAPIALFSGDLLFVGSVGRPDLLGEEETGKLARALYKSIQRIKELPDGTAIFPGHGAGSLCGAGMSHRIQSTIGFERLSNPFLAEMTETTFVENVLSTVPELPDYYHRMKELNSLGVDMSEALPKLELLTPERFAKTREQSQAIVVDLRSPEAFGGAHIPGSYNLGAGSNLSMWAAFVLPFNSPLLLVGDADTDLDGARRSLSRVAFDDVIGGLEGGVATWIQTGGELERITQASVRETNLLLESEDPPALVDVRSHSEWKKGHIPGALPIPCNELNKRLNELPPHGEVYVVCGSGYRSSLAASIVTRVRGLRAVNVSGGMAAWRSQKFPEVTEEMARSRSACT